MITANHYRRFLEALGLSQAAAGAIFDLDPRTSRRYALKETKVPEAINIVFRLMLRYNLTPEDIERLRKEKMP